MNLRLKKTTHYKLPTTHYQRGFSLVEVILATAVFGLLVTALVGAFLYGQEATMLAGNRARAVMLAEEGLEATRNIRDAAFSNIVDSAGTGLSTAGNQWGFSGSNDTSGIFTRQIIIASVDSNRKSITANVTWQQNPQRTGSVSLASRFTNWLKSVAKGGMLVLGNGGLTADTISYRALTGDSTWGTMQNAADIDTGTTNKALRAVQLYSSPTRSEKVMISRHYDSAGKFQFIYSQVWNGTTWGNVQLLSSWGADTFLDVRNFSGTYLANGDFMTVFADNTAIPKFRTWNGTAWSVQVSTQSIGSKPPTYVVARVRPGTNEVMLATFDADKLTKTQYFNGGTYTQANWSTPILHSNRSGTNVLQAVDFIWSPNNALKGGLAFVSNADNKKFSIRIWTADGLGGGAWSVAADSAIQAEDVGSVSIIGRKGADEFIACEKDRAGSPSIICYKSNFTPAITNPTNPTIILGGTDTGIQISFGIGFESVSGDPAINVYSDITAVPKLKKYTASTSTWDAAATNLNTLGGALKTVRMIPLPGTDDIMTLMGDANLDLYSVIWDGASNAMYTTPSGKAFSAHGTNGSAPADYWYDFAWD